MRDDYRNHMDEYDKIDAAITQEIKSATKAGLKLISIQVADGSAQSGNLNQTNFRRKLNESARNH